jgi:hypothetical protein
MLPTLALHMNVAAQYTPAMNDSAHVAVVRARISTPAISISGIEAKV